MATMPKSKSTASRLPIILVGTGLAVFVFYFIFLRGGKPPSSAEAAVTTPPTAASSTPTPSQPEPAEPSCGTPQPASTPPPASDTQLTRLLDAEAWLDARTELARLFAATTSDAQRSDLATKAIALNQRLLVTNADPKDVEVGDLRAGENLITFSRRFKQLHAEYGIVQLVNNIKNVSALRAGLRLRVPRGRWSLLVDKSLFTLYLCYEGAPYKSYRVCIGAQDNTPSAKFLVDLKTPKPTWTAPPDWLEREGIRGPVIPYGHPKNPLGEYWIGLEHAGYTGFGIHGTNQPESIGTKASMGCVRMLNDDVVELARIAHKGMDATIAD